MPNPRQLLIILLFAVGSAISVFGIWRLLAAGSEQRPKPGPEATPPRPAVQWRGWHVAALVAIVVGALLVRVEGLERRSMTHVEVYVPGIALPQGISEPPPRIGLLETISWHFHDEPHPQGYYFFMWGWTKVFGTSLWALRLPSVLFGVATVVMLYILAARLFSPSVGLVSAALLAFNGHQVYWSQFARMYTLSCLLGIVSTLLLVSLMRNTRRDARIEFGYVVVTWLMLFSQVLSWGLLAGQIVVALRYARTLSGRLPRALQLQGLVTILATPMLAHAVYRSRPTEFLWVPVWRPFLDFFTFGFLFEPDDISNPARALPLLLAIGLVAAVVVSLLAARRASFGDRATGTGTEVSRMAPLVLVAAGVSFVVFGLAFIAYRRQVAMALTASAPLLVVAVLFAAGLVWPAIAKGQHALDRRRRMSDSLGVVLLLGLVPMALLTVVHVIKPLLTSRGAIVYAPFLLMAIAQGVVAIGSRRVVALVVGLALFGVHAASVGFYRTIPGPNDYRSIARDIDLEFGGEDLIFVPPRNWVTTPLFYDLRAPHARLVTSDFAQAIAAHPGARVWMPLFSDQEPSDSMKAALAGFRVEKELTAAGGRTLLYVR